MKLLDLFCGAGGAAMGYYRAGFTEIVGVDIADQPNYPFEFAHGDALRFFSTEWADVPPVFDAIHASPPCQGFSNAQRIRKNDHPDLITPLRPLLEATGLPYVIENVIGAPLNDPVLLCGEMFGIKTYRHRLFETNFPVVTPVHPAHPKKQVKMGRECREGDYIQVIGNFTGADYARKVMQTPWMTRDEMAEAIPPAYTEHIGKQLLEQIRSAA